MSEAPKCGLEAVISIPRGLLGSQGSSWSALGGSRGHFPTAPRPKKKGPRKKEIRNTLFLGSFWLRFGYFRLKLSPPEAKTVKCLKMMTFFMDFIAFDMLNIIFIIVFVSLFYLVVRFLRSLLIFCGHEFLQERSHLNYNI